MTAIDYAALVERARKGIGSSAGHNAQTLAYYNLCNELANAIESLTQLATCGCGDGFTEHDPGTCGNCLAGMDKTADLARLIAERDAAKQKHALLEAEFLRSREAAGQIIVGRDVTIANLRAELDALRSVFHINMLRCFPEKSHEDVAAEIDKALEAERDDADRRAGASERKLDALQDQVTELSRLLMFAYDKRELFDVGWRICAADALAATEPKEAP